MGRPLLSPVKLDLKDCSSGGYYCDSPLPQGSARYGICRAFFNQNGWPCAQHFPLSLKTQKSAFVFISNSTTLPAASKEPSLPLYSELEQWLVPCAVCSWVGGGHCVVSCTMNPISCLVGERQSQFKIVSEQLRDIPKWRTMDQERKVTKYNLKNVKHVIGKK